VHYRVHSRQMLCIGGSQIPFGWSFLSIAKVPMTWSEGDVWTAEARTFLSAGRTHPFHQQPVCLRIITPWQCMVANNRFVCAQVELPANTRVEYKYVIMEEQVNGQNISKALRAHSRDRDCAVRSISLRSLRSDPLPWGSRRIGPPRSARTRRGWSASGTARSRTTRRTCRPSRSRWPSSPGSPAPTASSRSQTP